MNVTKETTGDLTAVLKIDVVAADYSEAVAKELKDYRKKQIYRDFVRVKCQWE